ncbi:TPA: hypothetical protein ACHKX3_003671 [Escherichia coli]
MSIIILATISTPQENK